MAVGVGRVVNDEGMRGRGVARVVVNLAGLGVMHGGNDVRGPSGHGEFEGLLLGKTASAELMVMVVEDNGNANNGVNAVVKILNGIHGSAIVVLDRQAGLSGRTETTEVGGETGKGSSLVAVSTADVNVNLGVVVGWKTHGVKDVGVSVKVKNSLVDDGRVG